MKDKKKCGKPCQSLILKEPVEVKCENGTFKIKHKIFSIIKSVTNGGARISLSGDYEGYNAIVLVLEK